MKSFHVDVVCRGAGGEKAIPLMTADDKAKRIVVQGVDAIAAAGIVLPQLRQLFNPANNLISVVGLVVSFTDEEANLIQDRPITILEGN